jgi:hypothetical protein
MCVADLIGPLFSTLSRSGIFTTAQTLTIAEYLRSRKRIKPTVDTAVTTGPVFTSAARSSVAARKKQHTRKHGCGVNLEPFEGRSSALIAGRQNPQPARARESDSALRVRIEQNLNNVHCRDGDLRISRLVSFDAIIPHFHRVPQILPARFLDEVGM